MRRFLAWTVLCWFGACTAWEPLTLPLTFGMSRDEVEVALGVPLIHIAGRRGSDIYLAVQPARIPGIYPVDERITLQFRNRRLTGWKYGWERQPTFW
jgi:hypothetical protein